MSHTRRASSQIRTDQAGAVSAVPVDELLADPSLAPDAAARLESNKQTGKGDSIVGKNAGGPITTARDMVAERIENPLNFAQLMKVQQPIPGGTLSPVLVDREIARMSADGFSEVSQRRFIDELKKQSKLKGLNLLPAADKRFMMSDAQKTDLAYVAGILRKVSDEPSTPQGNRAPGEPDYDLAPLSEFFAEHGQRLRWFDTFDSQTHFSNLDRGSFRARLNAVLEQIDAGDKTITKPQIDSLLGMLINVKDIDDMKYARHQVNRRVITGQLVIPEIVHLSTKNPVTGKEETKEVRLRERFDDFMSERLVDQVDVNQIGLEAYMMRQALKEAHSNELGDGADRSALDAAVTTAAKRLRASIEQAASSSDPDALFYARRVVCRQLGDKCGVPAGAALRNELLASIDSQLGDKLDRHSRLSEIDSLVASGKIDHAQAAVARLGVVVSTSNTEYRAALPRFEEFLEVKVSAMVMEAWAETERTISNNMSGDEADSHGNVVRGESRRLREQQERLQQQRLFEMRILEQVQRLGQQRESVALSSDHVKRATTSEIVVKRDEVRGVDRRDDSRLITFKRVEGREQHVSVLYQSRVVRRAGAQTAMAGAMSRLTAASTPQQIGAALGQMNQFAGEAAKNSGSRH